MKGIIQLNEKASVYGLTPKCNSQNNVCYWNVVKKKINKNSYSKGSFVSQTHAFRSSSQLARRTGRGGREGGRGKEHFLTSSPRVLWRGEVPEVLQHLPCKGPGGRREEQKRRLHCQGPAHPHGWSISFVLLSSKQNKTKRLQFHWALLAVHRDTGVFWCLIGRMPEIHCKLGWFFLVPTSSICVYISHLFFRDLLPKESSAIWLLVSSIHWILDAVYNKSFQFIQFTSTAFPCFHFIRCLCSQLFSVVGFSSFICWVTFVFLLSLVGCTSCE